MGGTRRPVPVTGGRVSYRLDRAGGGQRGGRLRYCAFWLGQDDQPVPWQFGAYLPGGQLAAHQAAYQGSDGVGIAAELNRGYQPAAQ